jgi:hypothetical protein
MRNDDFIPLTPEHQRQRARFLKVKPIILTDEEQLRQHGHNEWMKMRFGHKPGSPCSGEP